MPVDVTECKAKIECSREHLPCLQTLVEPVIDGDDEGCVKVRAALDHESGYHVFPVVAMLSAWRLNSGLVLGDLVHNLRSALDYLFWQLYSAHICMPESAQKTRQVQFPIDDKYERFFERRKRFSDIPYSLWSVLEAAQPYRRPNPAASPLRILRELSNRDKHRVLTPILIRPETVTFPLPTFRGPGSIPQPSFDHAADYLEPGAEVMRTKFSALVEGQEIEGHITPQVLFPGSDFTFMFGAHWVVGLRPRHSRGRRPTLDAQGRGLRPVRQSYTSAGASERVRVGMARSKGAYLCGFVDPVGQVLPG